MYRRVGGGWLRSPLWSHETGIFRVPVTGGASVRITRDGAAPQVAPGGRLFVQRSAGKDSTLVSMDLQGRDEHVHLRSKHATRFALSPDGRWVAFEEGYCAHVMPFVATGGTLEIGPDAKGLPVARVSSSTGASLHWAGDSRRLYWARGAELMQRDLSALFRFVEGAPDELPKPPDEGRQIGFDEKTWIPDGTLAIVGARVITMRGDEVVEDGTVLVRGDRIVAVGARASVRVPGGAHVIEGAGLTVVPGLIDVHWHGATATARITPQRNWGHYAALAFGVTTIHDPSNHTESIFAASELQRAGRIVAPRIFSTGTILYGADASIRATVENLDDARAHLRRLRAMGAFSVKSYNQPRRDQRQQILAAARELKMMVVPEGGAMLQHNLTQIVDGHTGIEHALPVARAYSDVVQLWSQTRVGYSPTLTVAYGGLMGEKYWYRFTNVWDHARLTRFVPRFAIDPKARRATAVPEDEWNHIAAAQLAKRLLDAGVRVQIGGHGQREGLGTHWEMWSFAQGGATPHEVLRAATLHGAAYLGLDRDLGSIEAGKLADLAILSKNPLEDIRHSELVRWVVVGGRLFDARTLDEAWPKPRPRGRLFFEPAAP